MTDLVLKKEAHQVLTLTLNRPERMNALNRPLLEALCREIEIVAARNDIRAVIFAGAGEKAFCAGADLKERKGMTADQTRSFLRLIRGTMDLIEGLPMPTFAAVEGYAFGGGCELMLACDFRVLAKGASVGLTECALGIIPGAGGTQRLPRLVGLARAKELIFSARRLSGSESSEIGLCEYVVGPGETVAKCEELAGKIRQCAPLAVQAAKSAIQGGFSMGIQEGLVLERRAYEVTLFTEDRLEALAAFQEKRPANFQGK